MIGRRKSSERKIKKWLEDMASQTDQRAILEKVGQFNLSELITGKEALDELFIVMDEAPEKFGPQRFPYFLDALYRSNNPDKMILFCYLLDTNCESMAFITNLENYGINEDKFKILLPALISVIERCRSGIGDCMYLILLKKIYNRELFTEHDIERIIKAVLSQAESILNWIDETKPNMKEIPITLEILMDVAGHFRTDALLDLAQRALKIDNNSLKTFAAAALIAGGRPVSPADLEAAAADLSTADKLLTKLERVGKSDLFPEKYARQEHIAKSNLCNWLAYPTELGHLPDEIDILGTFEYDFGDENQPDEAVFYVFKFRSDKDTWRDKGWMVGLSGGYSKNKTLSSNSAGHTFSMFESLEGDGMAQGREIFDLICGFWKQKAAEIRS